MIETGCGNTEWIRVPFYAITGSNFMISSMSLTECLKVQKYNKYY